VPSDPSAEPARLREQEERAVELIEEHRRQLATLQALLEDARRRGEAPDAVEARIEAAEEGVARAGREIVALRERIAAAERAPPADPRDGDEEA
jgi:predicted  nucleic acid-binding Zn-ribbon protein